MAIYDIAVGACKTGIDNALAALHKKPEIYNRYFKGETVLNPINKDTGKETGKETGKDTGKDTGKNTGKDTAKGINFSWDIAKPPTVTLCAPSNDKWKAAIGTNGEPVSGDMPGSNVFQMQLPSCIVQMGGAKTDITGLCIYAQLGVADDRLSAFVQLLAINEDDTNMTEKDKLVFNSAVSDIFNALGPVFKKFDLPPATQTLFGKTFTFTSFVLRIMDECLVMAASVDGNPLSVDDAVWPKNNPVFILTRPELINDTLHDEIEMAAKDKIDAINPSGKQGKIDWSAAIRLNQLISLTARSGDETLVDAKVDISISARADVANVPCSMGAATDKM